nr:U5 small nuclear ribonucleoprotein helicase [Tanacetum cinerariifolium]
MVNIERGFLVGKGIGSGNSVKEKGPPMDDGLDVGNGGEASGFVTSNIKNSPSPPDNVPNSISFATKVKFHDVPITAFTEYGLSAIATKLGSPLMLDSYTAAMCIDSWGRASYARAMIDLKLITLVDEEEGEGNQTPSTKATFVVMNEASASKPSTYMRDQLVESDEDEVKLANDETSRYMSSTRRGGFCEDDLDFYNRYEARVYDLPEQMQTFCDQFDIRLRSRVKK